MAELDIAHVARIARLSLTEPERARFAEEAARILAHFEAVERAQGEPPAPPAPLEPRADDALAPDPGQVEAIVGQFPRKEGRLAKVPEGL